MYRDVTESADTELHFETGRDLAVRLGYGTDELEYVPDAVIDSFAGVDYYFDLAEHEPGEVLLDLSSRWGMDTFVAGSQTQSKTRFSKETLCN
ncbi:hypothetical protein [Natrinema salinisoli]|uniref:hypothetical protein n=1 Tax=Natrinema salinisoli TaxID=2878535 RepID=UPI001CEFCBB9|nr:hypothetical protein [Natrinema salinisoli]